MTMHIEEIRADLIAEQADLDEVVGALTPEQWSLATPSERWSIADQIGHLAYFDRSAVVAITQPEAFGSRVGELWAVAGRGDEAMDRLTLGPYRQMTPGDLLDAWRSNRDALAEAAEQLEDDQRVDWYGPSMSSRSFLTARLMETWAHGQDIVDAVGVIRKPSNRLHHIARLGFITRGWSYTNRGLAIPSEPVSVELSAPSGARWIFGPEGSTESVRGPAEDFCLVVTQRRHVDDTALSVTALGRDWLEKAQAFAGPATNGPTPRHRRH